MSLTFNQLVIVLVFYGITFLFLLNVGSSSLGYFVRLYRPSKERLNVFLDKLKFPFDIFASSRDETLKNLMRAKISQEQRRRVGYSIVALVIHLIGFVLFARFKDPSQILVSFFWMALYVVTHISMWQFGKGLKPI